MKCKNIIFSALLYVLISFSSHAQDSIIVEYDSLPTWEESIEHFFGALNTNEISSGFLADRGLNWVNPARYDGAVGSDTIEHFGNWKALYAGIMSAALDSVSLTPHWDQWAEMPQGIIFFPVMHYSYHRFIADSAQLWQLIYLDANGRLQDVSERSLSPYEEAEVFAAAPMQWEFYDTLQITFRLDDNLIFGNTGKTILNIEMDSDNGQGYQTINLNEDISANWDDYGIKTIVLRITYTDSSQYISYSQIKLINTVPETGQSKRWPLGLPGYDALPDATPYITSGQGQNLGAVLEIEYGCGNHSITKPLIVVEGFNTAEFDGFPRGTTYWNFFNNLDNYRVEFNYSFRILDSLEAAGYDIIYIDFDQGDGNLRENAYVVMAAIEWINQQKAFNGSTEPNILMGLSMGGVVARYALLEMEEENIPHDVKYYISFDSPHLGANVPVGFQYMIEHLYNSCVHISQATFCIRDFAPELIDAYNVLQRPAVQQMLRYSTVFNIPPMNSLSLTTSAPIGTVYSDFYDELRLRGMPVETERNIAIANGNDQGISQGFNPSNPLFNALNPILYNEYRLFKYSLKVNATPEFSSSPSIIYKGAIWFEPLGNNTTQIYFAYPFISKLKNSHPYDNAPGGQYNTTDFGFDPNMITFGFQHLEDRFCFIPTVSALNIESEIDNPHYIADEQTVVVQAKTNFDEVHLLDTIAYQPTTSAPANENHILFTPSNSDVFANWLFEDIDDLNVLNSVYKRTFNFGEHNFSGTSTKTTGRLINQITVSGTSDNLGKIGVNCNDKIGFTDVSTNPVANTSKFGLSITVGCTGSGGIIIEDYGQFIIGTDNNMTGEVRVKEDALVHIKSGGKLIVKNGSKLIIEEGANFIFEDGASLELIGNNSELIFQGKLSVPANTDFTFSGDGHIVFDQDIPYISSTNSYDLTDYMDIGSNATFKIIRSGIVDMDHILVECRKSAFLKDAQNNAFAEVEFYNGRIALNPGKMLYSYGQTKLNNVKINPIDGSSGEHGGLRIFYNSSSVTNYIKNTIVEKGNPGVYIHWLGSASPISITGSVFRDCVDALVMQAGNISLSTTDFINNNNSLIASDVSGVSSVNGCTFDHIQQMGNYGLSISGQSGSLLNVEDSDFLGCYKGLVSTEVDVMSRCSQYKDNVHYGMEIVNAKAYLDDNAENVFYNNEFASIALWDYNNETGIYLLDGYNSFDHGLDNNNLHISGYFEHQKPFSDYNPNDPNEINADYNSMTTIHNYNNPKPPVNLWVLPSTYLDVYIPNNLSSINFTCEYSESPEHPYTASVLNISTGGGIIGGGLSPDGSLKGGILSALEQINFTTEGNLNDSWALKRLIDIQNATISNPDANTGCLLKTAYNATHKALNNAYQFGAMENNEGEPGIVNDTVEDVIAVIENRLFNLDTIDSLSFTLQFRYTLDKVHAYRVSGYYNEALGILVNSQNWTFNYEQIQRAGYWDCVCNAEFDFFSDQISFEELSHELEYCTFSYAPYNYKKAPETPKTEKSLNVNLIIPDIILYPQPVKNILYLEADKAVDGKFYFVITDLSGKLLKKSMLNWKGKIKELDVSEISSGAYLLIIQGERNKKSFKFIKE